jgi:hypothetical protein
VDLDRLRGRLDELFIHVGLEPQKAPPFLGRRYRYRPPRRVARAMGPDLTAIETWRADPDPCYPEGDLAAILEATLGVHKWLHYIPIYEAAFAGLRHTPIRFLEIGVDRGGSLEAWSRYFGPEASIVGIDINPWCATFDDPEHGRHVRIGGQQDPEFLDAVVRELGPFDVVLDDGSHRPAHTNASFRHLFDRGLVAGGLYVVEDLQTNFWRSFRDAPLSFVDLAKGLVDEMHAHYPAVATETAFQVGSDDRRSSFDVPRITKLLDSIQFFDSMVVIRKAHGERHLPASTFTPDRADGPRSTTA